MNSKISQTANLATRNTLLAPCAVLFFSCTYNSARSSDSKIFTYNQYQSGLIGSEYVRIRKPSKRAGEQELHSVSAQFYAVKPYFEGDENTGFIASYQYSSFDGNFYSSFSPFYYSGAYNANSLTDSLLRYNGTYNYTGGGIRLEGGYNFGDDFVVIRPANVQFVFAYEMGDYYEWRKTLSRKSSEFKNFGRGRIITSFYYVPEFLVRTSNKLSLGVHYGFGASINSMDGQTIENIFGLSASYKQLMISFTKNESSFAHIVKTHTFPHSHTSVLESKQATYTRFNLSYSF